MDGGAWGGGYSPCGCKESDVTGQLSARARTHTHTHTHDTFVPGASAGAFQKCRIILDPPCRRAGNVTGSDGESL